MFAMLKQKQKWLHEEEGHAGDCYRTCIANYLGMDRDSVPHFVHEHGGEGWEDGMAVNAAVREWLSERGMIMVEVPMAGDVPFAEVAAIGNGWLGGVGRLIIGGVSVRGLDHVILWDEREGYWDPAKNDDGSMLVGPQLQGVWWVIAILPDWSMSKERMSYERERGLWETSGAQKILFHKFVSGICSSCGMVTENYARHHEGATVAPYYCQGYK